MEQELNRIIKFTKENGFIDSGKISDTYHTFNDLYEHRCILYSVICNQNKDKAWKSKKHSDGTMYDNSFIVSWDGYTPEGVLERLKSLSQVRRIL